MNNKMIEYRIDYTQRDDGVILKSTIKQHGLGSLQIEGVDNLRQNLTLIDMPWRVEYSKRVFLSE